MLLGRSERRSSVGSSNSVQLLVQVVYVFVSGVDGVLSIVELLGVGEVCCFVGFRPRLELFPSVLEFDVDALIRDASAEFGAIKSQVAEEEFGPSGNNGLAPRGVRIIFKPFRGDVVALGEAVAPSGRRHNIQKRLADLCEYLVRRISPFVNGDVHAEPFEEYILVRFARVV